MKKYFNYYGALTDDGEYHVVQNKKVMTYEKRSMFKAAKVIHEQPITQDTTITDVLVHDLGPKGRGYCKLTTGPTSHMFYVANGIEDFINEVRHEMGFSRASIKNAGGYIEIS